MRHDETMMSFEEARTCILEAVVPLSAEEVSLFEAEGRVLCEDIAAESDIPPFNNSAMDGYAVIAADTREAMKGTPLRLRIVDEIRAGETSAGKGLSPGQAIRIMTGAPIPGGADAVVQLEDTREDGAHVLVFRAVNKNENIRFAGEDIRRGTLVLRRGDQIRPADAGLCASLNYGSLPVYRRPLVGILSTGDEIVDVGGGLPPGKVRNSNAYTLYSEIKRYHALPRYLGIAPDTEEGTAAMLESAMDLDVLITTGGVSKGRYDFVRDALRRLGFAILVESIAMKPGKPCVFGKKGPQLFFGLPGNPVSTMVSFIQFVRPALLRLMGAARIDKPVVNAILNERIVKKKGRTHFIRAYFTVRDGELHVGTTGPQGSGILRSMSSANCLIILPADTSEVLPGERVAIQLIQHGEV